KDPADLIADGGAEAMAAAIESSAPFVRFRVERALADGDTATPEGRDHLVDTLVPVFATLPPSAMRLELTRIVSERLSLPESLAERLLGGEGRGGAGARGRPDARASSRARPGPIARRSSGAANGSAGARERGTESERAFLALCIALPATGAQAL